MNQKGISAIVIILFIVGVLVVAGGIYYFAVQKLSQPEQPVLPTQPEEEQPSLTDETANWQTYRNEEYGFEVKYPESITLTSEVYKEKKMKIVIKEWAPVAPYIYSSHIGAPDAAGLSLVRFWIKPQLSNFTNLESYIEQEKK